MAMIRWIITTLQKYNELPIKDSNALYFLQDTQEIYKGNVSFTQPTAIVSDFPAKGALGRIYIHQTTLEGKAWNGSEWKTVIQPVSQSITGLGGETKSVSGNAVKEYVNRELTSAISNKFVESISYDKTTKKLKYVIGEQPSTEVDIGGFITNASYSGETGILTFNIQGGEDVTINLPKENFVKSGKYDPITKNLVLVLQDNSEINIPAGDLIDSSEFRSSETIKMSVSEEDGHVTADVIISNEINNALQKKSDGLFVSPTDVSNKLDKVHTLRENEIIIATNDGSVTTSGLKAGTDTLNIEPNSTTLATESAVAAAIKSVENNVIYKRNVVTSIDASSASEDNIISEKALVDAMTWMVVH